MGGHMRGGLAFCWFLMISFAEPAVADNKIVSPGTQVRVVTAVPFRTVLTGVFASVRADSLLLIESITGSERAVLISQIASVEVLRGTHSKVGRRARFGFLIGAITGGMWGFAAGGDSC